MIPLLVGEFRPLVGKSPFIGLVIPFGNSGPQFFLAWRGRISLVLATPDDCLALKEDNRSSGIYRRFVRNSCQIVTILAA